MENEKDGGIPFYNLDVKDVDSLKRFKDHVVGAKQRWRWSYELQWFINIAQFCGVQYLALDASRRGLVLPAKPRGRVRMTVNRVQPIVRNMISRASRGGRVMNVRPATSDDDDVAIAKTSNKILDYYWRFLEMARVRRKFMLWQAVCGNAFYKASWNPDKGSEITLSPDDLLDDMPEVPEEVAAALERARARFKEITGKDESFDVHMGEVEVEVLGPFNVLWDETLDFYDSPWVVVTKMRDLSYARDRWPQYAKNFKAETGAVAAPSFWEDQILTLNSIANGSKPESTGVLVHEVFVRPCERFKYGWYTVIVGDVVVENGENPYRGVPMSYAQDIECPGRPLATSTVEQIIPVQLEYNKTHSQIIENKNKIANPKILLDSASGVAESAFTDDIAEVVTYNIVKPDVMQMPPLPSYVLELLGRLDKDFEDISGQHEVTNAQAPGGVEAGYALQILLEQDDTRLMPFIQSANDAEEKLAQWVLRIVSMYVHEDRMITTIGSDGAYDAEVWFNGESIVGGSGGNYFDVKIESEVGVSSSAAGQKEALFELVNRGFLRPDDANDKAFVLRKLGLLSQDDEYLSDVELDESKARYENRMMSRGTDMAVDPHDNHVCELQVHNKFRKSPEFMQLAPEVQQLVIAHMDVHAQHLSGGQPTAQGQQQQMEQAALARQGNVAL